MNVYTFCTVHRKCGLLHTGKILWRMRKPYQRAYVRSVHAHIIICVSTVGVAAHVCSSLLWLVGMHVDKTSLTISEGL